ncbi:MAG: hypothetical protein AAB795_02245 [Patescibacteria group bacterium]
MKHKDKKQNRAIGFFVVLFFSFGMFSVSAAGRLDMKISTRSPAPGQQFTVSATSLEFDTVRGNFKWYLNDKLMSSGVGKTEQTFQAGPIGSAMNIRVSATSNTGGLFEGYTVIRINDIDFIVHPLTSIPPLYRGAPLAVSGSKVEIYAVPHLYMNGVEANPQNLIYEWTVDEAKELDKSGGGRNKIAVDLDITRDQEVEIILTASTIDRSNLATKKMILKSYYPEINFYSFNTLTGIGKFAKTLFEMKGGDNISILAVPYFMSNDSLRHAQYTWRASANVIKQNPVNPRLLELTAPLDSNSISSFSLKIQDPQAIYKNVSGSLSVRATRQ